MNEQNNETGDEKIRCPKCNSDDIDYEYDYVTKMMADVCNYCGHCLDEYSVSLRESDYYPEKVNDEDE